MYMNPFFVVWGIALSCLAAAILLRHEIGDLLTVSPERIQAEIQLDNRCKLQERSFVVRDIDTGSYAFFRQGVAKLRTVERNRLRIEFAPRYAATGAELSLPSYPAKQEMTLSAYCYSRGNWLKNLFNSH